MTLAEAVADIEPFLRELAQWPPGSSFGSKSVHANVAVTSDQAREILAALDAERDAVAKK